MKGKRYQKYYHVKTAASKTFAFSLKQNVYIIWINLATGNRDFALLLAFGIHYLHFIPLLSWSIRAFPLSIVVIFSILFPATKLTSKSSKALDARLTFIKIKIIPTEWPYLQTQGCVMLNEQFSSHYSLLVSTLTSDMTVLFGNDAFSIFQSFIFSAFNYKIVLQFFEKILPFPENLLQS